LVLEGKLGGGLPFSRGDEMDKEIDVLVTEGVSHRSKKLSAAAAMASRAPGEMMKDVAERAGVNVTTLRGYLKYDAFRELVVELTDNHLMEWMPQIDRAMVKAAIKGSVGAATFIAQRAGRTEVGIRDKNFQDFLKGLDDQDQFSMEYYMQNGYWPEDSETPTQDGPEDIQ